MHTLIPQHLVHINEQTGETFTTSLKVAEHFDRDHRNVMRDIRNIISMQNNLSLATLYELSAMTNDEIDVTGRLNFEQSSYKNEQAKDQPMYYLNRDGFMLLVMGYTGQKAFVCKQHFIVAFNYMEQQLHNQHAKESIAFYQLRTPWQAVVTGTQHGLCRADIAKQAGYINVGSVTKARARLKQLGVLVA